MIETAVGAEHRHWVVSQTQIVGGAEVTTTPFWNRLLIVDSGTFETLVLLVVPRLSPKIRSVVVSEVDVRVFDKSALGTGQQTASFTLPNLQIPQVVSQGTIRPPSDHPNQYLARTEGTISLTLPAVGHGGFITPAPVVGLAGGKWPNWSARDGFTWPALPNANLRGSRMEASLTLNVKQLSNAIVSMAARPLADGETASDITITGHVECPTYLFGAFSGIVLRPVVDLRTTYTIPDFTTRVTSPAFNASWSSGGSMSYGTPNATVTMGMSLAVIASHPTTGVAYTPRNPLLPTSAEYDDLDLVVDSYTPCVATATAVNSRMWRVKLPYPVTITAGQALVVNIAYSGASFTDLPLQIFARTRVSHVV